MRAAALLLLTGCDAVFGLSGHPGEMIDASSRPEDAIDVDAHEPSCTLPPFDLQILEDAEMISSNPTMGHGQEDILNIGVTINSVGIFKFDASGVAPTAIHHMKLHLPAVTSAKECGSLACGPCAPLDLAGKFRTALMRSDWNEKNASWSIRDLGQPWAAAGAQAIMDRSAITTITPYSGIGEAVIDVSAEDLAQWVTTGTQPAISVRVEGTDGATIVIRQHLWNETCPPTPQPLRLTVDPCP